MTFPELCHHPVSGHLHHLHSCTQKGAVSLCPGRGHQLLPGEGVICLLATSLLLLDLLTFAHVQLISQAPVVSQAPSSMSPANVTKGVFTRVAAGLSWVPLSHLCSGAPAHVRDQQLLGKSSWDFPPNPASHNHLSKPTFLFWYKHCEGRLKLSCFIPEMQPGQHTARERGFADMCKLIKPL